MKNLHNILLEVYNEVYKHTKPKLDFKKAYEKGEVTETDWFMEYFMIEEEQQKIMNEVMKKHKLKKFEKTIIENSYWLGCSPTSNEARWKRERNKTDSKTTV